MASTLQSAINTISNGVSKLTTTIAPATVRTGFGAVTSDASKVNPKTAALNEAALRGERVFPWEFDEHTRPYVASPRDPSSTPPALFKPITIKGTTYKNRIVVSPMCMYSSPNGLLTDWHLVHLGSFAIHGAGAIIIEASSVTPNGRISEYDSGIWSDAHIAPLKKVTDFIHQQHALVGIQLAHAGRKASTPAPFFVPRGGDKTTTPDSELGWTKDVWGPSAIPWDKNWIEPIALPKADIPKLVDAFVQAAQRADKAGIDFCEIHAAHGYLFSSWLSPLSNTRTDEYGGSRENRSRVLIETLKAVRAVWSTKPLWVRLSSDEFVPGGWSSDDTVWLAGELKKAGADVVDCSAGGNSADQKFPKLEEGYQVPYAEAVKKAHPDLTVAAVGMITKADFANKVVEDGKADFVLIAREFLRDPALVTRWAGQLDYEVNWQPQYARAKPSHSKHKQIETATQSDVGSGIKNRNLIE